MSAINAYNTNISNYYAPNTSETAVAAKAAGLSINDLSPILGQAVSKTLNDILRAPNLTAPSVNINKDMSSAVKAYLLDILENPSFIRDLGALSEKVESGVNQQLESKVKEQAEQGKPFDISGLSSSAVALIVAANVLMLALNTADTLLSGKLSQVSFDAAKSTAASMVREGMSILASSISQSTLQLGITAVGAKTEYKGISNERGALKHNGGKLEALNVERAGMKNALNTNNAAKLGVETDSLSKLETQSTKGQIQQNLNQAPLQKPSDSVNLQASSQQIKPEHQAALSRTLDDVDAEIATQQNALSDNTLKARNKQTTGDAIMKSSQAVGGVAGSSGQYTATLERSEQQISQANSRVASTAAEDTRESSQKTRNLIQELLRVMDSISQSQNAAIGTVAGNIRA
ncbi:IpaC/SipC family type III secretion system effector [Plesiomonas shigelloides]|uniref:Pathogenicity island 1 effector protein n=1 Tax=Plesiomonas shigelloides TaxID=703 RepID=A0A481WFN4_PLESH|nr:IpaC/SipC family type III secretion system effector [Plesiomonas shigelloides]KAB7715310.1 IpaC/SipC family type III secretion system effector [Plesiomonas shigelloides]QBJ27727.1 pathogenicity island 1 effector protein [Plesiomonas shigelloides]